MKKINELKSGFLTRNLTLARLAISAGSRFITSKKSFPERIKDSIAPNINDLVHEFSMMKGSIMKSGQMLSLFVGELLPKELRQVLSKLENQSYYLDFEEIKKQIPTTWLETLDIDPTPFAAASIGQVHIAKDLNAKKTYAMKIQYPGVEKAINNDITALRLLFNSIGLIPKSIDTDFIFQEVKLMLKQEMNYNEELRLTNLYAEKIKEIPGIEIVKPVEKYCTGKILTTEYIEAHEIRSKEVKNLSQIQRNNLGKTLISLYFKEIFEWGLIQTDAHFGNFMIKINNDKATLVVLDFGATKEASQGVLYHYRNLIKSCANREKELFFKSAQSLGYFKDDIDKEFFWDYAELLAKPYYQDQFNWAKSNLSDEIYKMIPKLITKIPKGKPVGEALFLDRKIGGIFYILKELECEFSLKPIKEKYFI